MLFNCYVIIEGNCCILGVWVILEWKKIVVLICDGL